MATVFFSQTQITWLAEQLARTTRALPDGSQRDIREAVKDLALAITDTNPKASMDSFMSVASPRPRHTVQTVKCADGITRLPPRSREISQFRAYDSAEKLGF